MKQEPQYQATKIRPIVQIAVKMVQDDPSLARDYDRLWANLKRAIPAVLPADDSKCGGCGRSMKVIIYEADLHDALLILAMGRQVKENLRKGMPFTEANKVHIPTLTATNATLKRQTKCDYLCLIKQPEAWRGTGFWVLTGWAWKALRGEEIPRAAKYWEGNLLGRSKATTTLSQMFNTHRDLVERALAKQAAVRADYRAVFADYHPHEWSEVSAIGEFNDK